MTRPARPAWHFDVEVGQTAPADAARALLWRVEVWMGVSPHWRCPAGELHLQAPTWQGDALAARGDGPNGPVLCIFTQDTEGWVRGELSTGERTETIWIEQPYDEITFWPQAAVDRDPALSGPELGRIGKHGTWIQRVDGDALVWDLEAT